MKKAVNKHSGTYDAGVLIKLRFDPMTVSDMSFYNTNFRPIESLRYFSIRFQVHSIVALAIFLLISLSVAGCASSHELTTNIITVSGRAAVMGNVPFTALILETKDRNSYILKLDPKMEANLMTPAQLTVTGKLYVGEWNGRPFAHIDVMSMEKAME